MAELNQVPPLTQSAGDLASVIMDRIYLHVRKHAPEQFGSITLIEIDLVLSELRDEVRRLISRGNEEG